MVSLLVVEPRTRDYWLLFVRVRRENLACSFHCERYKPLLPTSATVNTKDARATSRSGIGFLPVVLSRGLLGIHVLGAYQTIGGTSYPDGHRIGEPRALVPRVAVPALAGKILLVGV